MAGEEQGRRQAIKRPSRGSLLGKIREERAVLSPIVAAQTGGGMRSRVKR